MKHLAAALALAACSLTLLGAALPPAPAPAQPAGAPPLVQWTGYQTRRAQPGFVLIRDREAWQRLWTEHTGQEVGEGALKRNTAPLIDFDRAAVVAYFSEPIAATDGAIATEVVDLKDRLVVRYEDSTFQFHSIDGRGPEKLKPFGLWVIPATDKPIAIEHGTRNLKGQPVNFKEVHRFAARNK